MSGRLREFHPSEVPTLPGVYLHRDRFGRVIYVGSEPVFPAGQIEAGGCPGAFADEFDLFLGVFPGEKRR